MKKREGHARRIMRADEGRLIAVAPIPARSNNFDAANASQRPSLGAGGFDRLPFEAAGVRTRSQIGRRPTTTHI